MDGAIMQPYIHDCSVTVCEGFNTYTFRVFSKCHIYLKVNNTVRAHPSVIFRGDILVMKEGSRYNFVNMFGRDGIVADWLVTR